MRGIRQGALLAAVLVGAASVQAQTGVQLGVTAGLNMSTLAGGQLGTAKRGYRYDGMAGGSLIYPVSDMVAIQAELLYSREGGKVTDSGDEATFKFDYVTVPVLLRFALGDAKSQGGPAVYIGPYFAKKVGCSVEVKSGTFSQSGDCTSAGINVTIKGTDFGATAGGEVAFGSVGIFARYSLGLMSIDDSKPTAENITNRVITLGARFSFGSR